nr:MAG TPA: hypothetical protein [Caudoviricetes sp.]
MERTHPKQLRNMLVKERSMLNSLISSALSTTC